MSRNQYELDFEKHRQEIPTNEGFIPSRAELHGKKKDGQQHPMKLITIFLAIFTLIPIIFLLYVLIDLNSPSVSDRVPVEKTEVSIHETSIQTEHQMLGFPRQLI